MEAERPLSAEAAAAIWARAAQLQSEAAQRLDERSRALTANAATEGQDPESFSLADVRAAASEVGISAEFVALAINELSSDPAGSLPPEQDEKATRFLGTADRSLELSRTIDRPVVEVYNALLRVLPAHPWLMSLRDVSGDPLAGGAMIFTLPVFSMTATTQSVPLAYYGYSVDVTQVQLMLRPVPGLNAESCEVLLRAGLHRSVRRNFRFGRWSAGVAGVMGGGVVMLIGAGAMGLGAAVVALPAMAAGALVGGGAALGYKASYRYYLRKLTDTFTEMLSTIAAHTKTGGAFIQPVSPPPKG